jgi:hypothetical protein
MDRISQATNPTTGESFMKDKFRKLIVRKLIEYHKQQIRLLEKTKGKAALVKDGEIITVMPRYKRLFQE